MGRCDVGRWSWPPDRSNTRPCRPWLMPYGGRDAAALARLSQPGPAPERRPPPSLLVTDVDGGHDMDVRILYARGVQLHGRVLGIADGLVTFADNAESIAAEADVGCAQFVRSADEYATQNGLDLPASSSSPLWPTPIREDESRSACRRRAQHPAVHGLPERLPLDTCALLRRAWCADPGARCDGHRRSVLRRAALDAHHQVRPVLRRRRRCRPRLRPSSPTAAGYLTGTRAGHSRRAWHS
jgi:hypothetical protein